MGLGHKFAQLRIAPSPSLANRNSKIKMVQNGRAKYSPIEETSIFL